VTRIGSANTSLRSLRLSQFSNRVFVLSWVFFDFCVVPFFVFFAEWGGRILRKRFSIFVLFSLSFATQV